MEALKFIVIDWVGLTQNWFELADECDGKVILQFKQGKKSSKGIFVHQVAYLKLLRIIETQWITTSC